MKELFTLGEIYPSDFLKPDESPHTDKLKVIVVSQSTLSKAHL